MTESKQNDVQEAIEELLTDPDAPEKGNSTPPPQTTDAEPTDRR
ncbi:hypothetical protein [uncultured Sphingomonas sp.]